MKGLIIDEPWIGMQLEGIKHWEMRTRQTSIRGTIGLIRKGSGLVVGQADLIDSPPIMSVEGLLKHFDKHRIPPEMILSNDYKWLCPWILDNIIAYEKPVPYQHKRGAVIWVNL